MHSASVETGYRVLQRQVHTYVNAKQISLSKDPIEIVDEIAVELSVSVYINGVLKEVLITSPHKLLELGQGYALTHNLSVDESNIQVLDTIIMLHNAVELNTTCKVPENSRIGMADVFKVFHEVIDSAVLFKRTGCFHVAAIATLDGRLIGIVEDISRYCALYKVVGEAYRKGVDFRKTMIVLSSRASSDLVKGIANLCIPIAVFRGAPTLNAIEVAEKAGITLMAHVRGGRANVYTRVDRVLL